MESEHQLSTQEMKQERPTEAVSHQTSSVVTGTTSRMEFFLIEQTVPLPASVGNVGQTPFLRTCRPSLFMSMDETQN